MCQAWHYEPAKMGQDGFLEGIQFNHIAAPWAAAQIPPRQDMCADPAPARYPLAPVHWTEVQPPSAGKIDAAFLRFAVGEFQTGLRRHRVLGNGIFWQTTGAGNCHLEPSVSKLMREETEPATIIGRPRQETPEANGWMNTRSGGTTERHRLKVTWTNSPPSVSLLTCTHAACSD